MSSVENITTDRFVAFIDILGFKNLVDNSTHEQVLNKLEIIKKSLDEIDNKYKGKLKTWIFSDSILIISKNDNYNNADSIMINTSMIVETALRLGLLVKGVIAHGKFTADFERTVFFGKPLIDAYVLQEEIKLSSIVLHHSFEKKLQNYDEKTKIHGNGRCFEYLTPIKTGHVNHMHLNWLEYKFLFIIKEKENKNKKVDEYTELLKSIYLTVSGYSRIYIDNTLRFIEECRKISIN